MNDKDSKLIWESLQQATNPVSEADTEDPRYAQLIQYFMQSDGDSRQEAMQMAKETISKLNAKKLPVKHESSPGPEAFMMDEQDWEQAKQDLSDEANQPGLPEVLQIFKKRQADVLDKPQPVVITAWQTQKHYGKIHKSGTKVAGESINDAISKLASDSNYPKKGYIIQKIEVDREGVDHEKRRHDHAGKHAYPRG